MVDGDGGDQVKGGEIPRFEIKVTHEAKLNEILHKINSIEIKLCSDGVKEFIKLLKHKEMYSGVLHGLGNDDDDENFIYVLSTLKEMVLVEESLVPLVWYTKASFRGTEVAGLDSFIGALNHGSYSSNQMMQGWAALKQGIQNEVRTLNFVKACSPIVEHIERYDTVFILLFSVHILVIMSILNLWRLLV
nr:hypothetical protein CFP56_71223 [Quercus suber]